VFQGDGCIMRIKPSDLNVIIPPMRKAQLIAEVNSALEISDRLDDRILFWLRPKTNNLMIINLIRDEFEFIKKGKA